MAGIANLVRSTYSSTRSVTTSRVCRFWSGSARGGRLLGHCCQRSFASMRADPERSHVDGADHDDFHIHTAQRWLWNEAKQLAIRSVRFNAEALIRAIEQVSGSDSKCVAFAKLPEGNFNKTFLAKMQNGSELIARLPNPNAGRPYYTTASEVATMDYARTRLEIPVPRVLAYSSRANETAIGAEYIIMERCAGVELASVWNFMSSKERVEVIRKIAIFSARLFQARFPAYGSLYFTSDVQRAEAIVVDDVYSVGLTASRTWFDDGRGEVQVDRGPWTTAPQVITAIVEREAKCLDSLAKPSTDCLQGFYNGPCGYEPLKASKLSVLQDFALILPHIVPKDDRLLLSTLWHNDLHPNNIFVDSNNPTQITGIIDWQGVNLSPAFLQVHYPALIEYDGPLLDLFQKPKLPVEYEELDHESKQAARALFLSQTLWSLYQITIRKHVPDLLHILQYRDTLVGQLINLIGSTFDDGECYIQHLIDQLIEPQTWPLLAGESNCPLVYSTQLLASHQEQLVKWQRDVERKANVLQEIGAPTGWNGAVDPNDFAVIFERLKKAKQNFLSKTASSPEERLAWEQVWPFKDSD